MTSWDDIDALISEIESREKGRPDGRSGRREARRTCESPQDHTSAQEDDTRQQPSDQATGHTAPPAAIDGTAAASEADVSVMAERQEIHRRPTHQLPPYDGGIPADTYLLQVQFAAQLNAWTAEETEARCSLSGGKCPSDPHRPPTR